MSKDDPEQIWEYPPQTRRKLISAEALNDSETKEALFHYFMGERASFSQECLLDRLEFVVRKQSQIYDKRIQKEQYEREENQNESL